MSSTLAQAHFSLCRSVSLSFFTCKTPIVRLKTREWLLGIRVSVFWVGQTHWYGREIVKNHSRLLGVGLVAKWQRDWCLCVWNFLEEAPPDQQYLTSSSSVITRLSLVFHAFKQQIARQCSMFTHMCPIGAEYCSMSSKRSTGLPGPNVRVQET